MMHVGLSLGWQEATPCFSSSTFHKVHLTNFSEIWMRCVCSTDKKGSFFFCRTPTLWSGVATVRGRQVLWLVLLHFSSFFVSSCSSVQVGISSSFSLYAAWQLSVLPNVQWFQRNVGKAVITDFFPRSFAISGWWIFSAPLISPNWNFFPQLITNCPRSQLCNKSFILYHLPNTNRYRQETQRIYSYNFYLYLF
jgi:hypothetical protein